MNKFLHSFLLFLTIIVFLIFSSMLSAQTTFTRPDITEMGITTTDGMQGFAWGDYDGDGDMDLFQSGSGNASILYMNDVLGDSGKFIDVSAQGILVDETGAYAQGALFMDYDNDGYLDILSVDGGLKMYKNDGAVFTDVSELTGLTEVDAGVQLWQATAGDFDHDGDLDIAIAGGDQGAGATALPTRLLRYAEGGYSEDATAIIGFELVLESWNPMWVDVNNDGWLDLWMPTIRTPGEPCALLINNNGTELSFSNPIEIGLVAASAIQSSWADFDNDGDMDLFLTPYSGDADGVSKFFRNDGGTFIDIAEDLGLNLELGDCRGSCWGDYNNDGNIDLLINHRSGPQELYQNDGGSFIEVGEDAGVGISDAEYRSPMFVDYNNDGFLDIYLSGSTPKALLQNEGTTNHWIGIVPQGDGVTNNTAAIGARIRVVSGSLSQIRNIEAGGPGGMANGNLRAHFGLGEATTVDSVIIYWPNGLVSEVFDLEIDQYHVINQSALAVNDAPIAIPENYALFQNYPNPFNPITTISFNIPKRSNVRIELVNIVGEVIDVIANGNYTAGHHEITLKASNLSTGLYFYRMEAGNFSAVKKLVLIK